MHRALGVMRAAQMKVDMAEKGTITLSQKDKANLIAVSEQAYTDADLPMHRMKVQNAIDRNEKQFQQRKDILNRSLANETINYEDYDNQLKIVTDFYLTRKKHSRP